MYQLLDIPQIIRWSCNDPYAKRPLCKIPTDIRDGEATILQLRISDFISLQTVYFIVLFLYFIFIFLFLNIISPVSVSVINSHE